MDKIIRLLTANIKETLRDKATLFWTILFPIIFIAIFGIVYGNEEYPPMDVGLAVEETNDAVQPLIDGLKEVEMFAIEEGSRDDLEQKLHDGKLVAVIIVEKGFARDFLRQEAQVIVKYDPANRTSSEVVLSALSAVIDGMNQFITQTKDPISLKPESVQTEGTRMIEWLVPGILGMSIMQLGLFASATFVTQREKKLFRRLAVTPIKRHHVVISQVLFRLIFGVIQSTILLLFGWLLYRVPVHGNLIILLSVICVSVVMFLSMGYIIASLAKNEESVEPIVQVFAMPMMFLSGVFFPIELMPEFIRPFVRALPLTYLNDALRAVINQAEGFAAIGTDLLVMGIWLVGSLAVAVKIFKWE